MKALKAATVLSLLVAGFSPAKADWWKDHNPFRQITPNWGPLIPHPQTLQELLPVCIGAPQKCRDENMPGDTKTTPAPTPVPAPVETPASATSICVQPDGQGGVVAWFYPLRPAQYQQSSPLTVTNLKQCGEHTISGPALSSNTLNMVPTGWNETVFSNGTKFWMMRGRVL